MNIDGWGHVFDQAWQKYSGVLTVASSVLLVLLAVFVVAGSIRLIKTGRKANRNLKLSFGQAIVQAGVTTVVVGGTYKFGVDIFHLPWWEAAADAVFLEAAVWVAAGMIYDHGKRTDDEGNQLTGFGPAGPFFWLFSGLGGLLAVTAATSWGEGLGRAVVVVFGACLWYLTLRRVTRRPDTPGRWRWTPHRLLVAIGAIEPGEHDVADENHEWQVRRLAKAMRHANGNKLVAWWGKRRLTRLTEVAKPDVVRDARRRFAAAHLTVANAHVDSPVMQRVIAEVARETDASASESARNAGQKLVAPPQRRAREVVMRRPVSAPPASSKTAGRVIAAFERHPKATNGQIAQETGLSLATVKRYKPRQMNGHASDLAQQVIG